MILLLAPRSPREDEQLEARRWSEARSVGQIISVSDGDVGDIEKLHAVVAVYCGAVSVGTAGYTAYDQIFGEDNTDCTGGKVNNGCDDNASCHGNNTCDDNDTCEDNSDCNENGTCSNNTSCDSGWVGENGGCTENTTCSDNPSCNKNNSCDDNNVCNGNNDCDDLGNCTGGKQV